MNARSLTGACICFVIWIALILGCNAGRKEFPKLTSDHHEQIDKALVAKGYPEPALEIADSGFLVATFELSGPRTPQELRAYAEGAVIIIRNTMRPYHLTDKYRVVLNGPSPGEGLIRRYGVARFMEGDQVRWEPAN